MPQLKPIKTYKNEKNKQNNNNNKKKSQMGGCSFLKYLKTDVKTMKYAQIHNQDNNKKESYFNISL